MQVKILSVWIDVMKIKLKVLKDLWGSIAVDNAISIYYDKLKEIEVAAPQHKVLWQVWVDRYECSVQVI